MSGPGDYGGYDNFVFSGAGNLWTNWNTGLYAAGTAAGRITGTLGCRWAGSGAAATGRNVIWWGSGAGANGRIAFTANFNGGSTSTYGNWNTANASADGWFDGTPTFYGGFWRTASQSGQFGFKNGVQNSYAGKSADDATNLSGTTNWNSTPSPGGIAWSAAVTISSVYVRRSGVYTPCLTYVWRSGAWTIAPVLIWRSGLYSPVNYGDFMRIEGILPPQGLPVLVRIGDGPVESGFVIEEESGWMGPVDLDGKFVGRYNSWEPEEVAQARLYIQDRIDRANAEGRPTEDLDWAMSPERLPVLGRIPILQKSPALSTIPSIDDLAPSRSCKRTAG